MICESGREYQDSRHGIPEFSLVIFESGGEFLDSCWLEWRRYSKFSVAIFLSGREFLNSRLQILEFLLANFESGGEFWDSC